MISMEDISSAAIAMVRLGVIFRFIYCMVRLEGAEEEHTQYKKRAKNALVFYILAESVWQLKDLVFYYYGT